MYKLFKLTTYLYSLVFKKMYFLKAYVNLFYNKNVKV